MPTNTSPHPGSLAHEALAYASRGFLIFPLWHCANGICQCADHEKCGSPGKHPRTKRGLTDATSDLDWVEAWWSMWPDANIGLPAGMNGLAFIDIDPYHGGEASLADLDQRCMREHGVDLWATRAIRTGSGGYHLAYLDPRGACPTKARTFGMDGIDTRGRGGYVVAPPSVHASGNRYELVSTGHGIAPWPDCLTRRLEPAPPVVGDPLTHAGLMWEPRLETSHGRARAWAAQALQAECQQLMTLPGGEGNRKNEALNNAAYKMGRRVGAGYLDENHAADCLYAAASRWPGHTERELRATIRSGLQAGMRKPHPGPTTRGGAR